jgi:hypothetical protein
MFIAVIPFAQVMGLFIPVFVMQDAKIDTIILNSIVVLQSIQIVILNA